MRPQENPHFAAESAAGSVAAGWVRRYNVGSDVENALTFRAFAMKTLILALLMLGAAIAGHARGAALTPGIYRIDAGSYLTAVQRAEAGPNKRIEEKFEHAFCAAAGVAYAVVSREARYAEPERNRVLFLTADGYKADVEHGERSCIAYALPGGNDYSTADPFCAGAEALSDRTLASFILWPPPRRRDLGDIHIPRERTPTQDDRVGCLLG
ncbi:hypothetical protein CBM2587_A10295 [Cupriavidus taiwanensis]|uniref:Uncharacterized protein n=2 Tax=Cupriavidus taiwanensis TaxID=164546 RepID=A0A975ZWL6_9BURK|nr:hypothetical protein CBM2587_A10295 [Cupriavidus taiwanensis]